MPPGYQACSPYGATVSSWSLATACLDRIAHLYRPEEQRELHGIFYEAAQAALLYYEQHAERERRRLIPSKN
jgi:hypothetical protein